jgi:ABC-2 type transport system ATP-binding protein
MPDGYGTYSYVNVREYLDFFARAYGLRGRERKRAVQRVESFTKLDQLAEKPITGLSKGMKQRLCLGRALIHDPAVLVLDEPAAGLDPRARIELREMIRRLADEGKAVLISSHILTELAEMCDSIGIIEQGQLLALGSVDEIHQRHESRRAVRIRVLGGAEAAVRVLTEHHHLDDIQLDGEELRFLHAGDIESDADLLKELIQAGIRVAAFGSANRTLEDIFMQVTEGRVQ